MQGPRDTGPRALSIPAIWETNMPEPRDHTEDRNWIEAVLRYVPGFRGYLEKEYRRESDDLQRDWLADRLQRSKRAINASARPCGSISPR